MKINTENLISITEVNQNFSRAIRLVDDKDLAIIMKNNMPKYVLLKFDAIAEMATTQVEDIEDTIKRTSTAIARAIRSSEDDDITHGSYCTRCRALFSLAISECPHCDSKLRKPSGNDPVRLLTANMAETIVISPLLTDQGIPFTLKGDASAGGFLGSANTIAQYIYDVPYDAYQAAKELLKGWEHDVSE